MRAQGRWLAWRLWLCQLWTASRCQAFEQMAGRLVKGSLSIPGGPGHHSDALACESRPSAHVVPLGDLWPWAHPQREAFT